MRKTPDPPAGASIVAPATLEEQVATSLHLNWAADVVDVSRENEGRARLARDTLCPKVLGNPPP